MKNRLKLVLAVSFFTLTSIISVHNSHAKKQASGGRCSSSDAECGMDLGGNQICGTYSGPC